MLGMHAGESLSMVAFGDQEPNPAEGLQIWATLPKANPVNSARANERAPLWKLLAEREINIPLFHFGRWESTGDGLRPNSKGEGQKTDVQLEGLDSR